MADIDYDGFDPAGSEAAPEGGWVGQFFNFIGAVLSLALIAGLAVWGYELLVRDVTGVPVVQALEGPMRVAPDDPGGEQAAHLGLAVNRIAAVGDAAPPPDRITLAPRSADLEAEDFAQAALRLSAAVTAVPEAEAGADPVAAALLAVSGEVAATEALLSNAGLAGPIPASTPGVARSLVPRARPENIVPAQTGLGAAADEIDAATIAPGTKLVQFSAHGSAAEARTAWTRLARQFGGLMADKERVIEEASNGGRVFYRLRAMGFADDAASRRFCAAIIAEGSECIPVTAR